ncbi:MAG: glycosyltransferase family 4 protein [Flavobacteriales bacterium]|nr:glycosyltransferase family 4 protein [Flavobacteriales bacterium]MBK6752186.1 glycosyltransferase family 4 protein [Flavobacteriales bacterium]MBK9075393.1 glycosyltransferase family 4 protein [Flavobacteriales bacterium]
MPKVLFVASHRPGRSPNQRFRFEQYRDYLATHGFQSELSYLVEEADDRYFYKPGNVLKKLGFVRRSFAKRRKDVARMGEFDIIFVCREALMTRSTVFERAFAAGPAKVIYDFDDSIWLQNVSDANRTWAWVKDAGKTAKLIALADMVFAGNDYLANYARGFNKRVEVVPTTIDTDEYKPAPRRGGGPVCIGWSGSITTIQHFQYALPALRILKERFGDRITIRVIGDGTYSEPSLGIQGQPWRRDTEVADLAAFDIGIMPLPDDEWARGKCGLKGLQYMGMGIPAIMSPVGVNGTIITDGVNGFLASSTEEWVAKVSRLIEDAELRQRIGSAARRSVEDHWSVNAWRDRYLTLFNQLLQAKEGKVGA